MTSFVTTIGRVCTPLIGTTTGQRQAGTFPSDYRLASPAAIIRSRDIRQAPPNAYTPPPYSYDFKNLIFVISVVLLPYASEISVKFSRFRDFIV